MDTHDTPSQAESPQTRAGKRIAELDQVEEDIAALLHFAGCTLASLHPDPLTSFTARELAVDEDDDGGQEGGESASQTGARTSGPRPRKPTPRNEEEAKLAEFAKYADGYYATLNDIQLALRTSIRHLRVSRVSPRSVTDPAFASLVYRSDPPPPAGGTSTAAATEQVRVGPGGIAPTREGDSAAEAPPPPLSSSDSTSTSRSGWNRRIERLPGESEPGEKPPPPPSEVPPLSVAALEQERDALRDLVAALESNGAPGLSAPVPPPPSLA